MATVFRAPMSMTLGFERCDRRGLLLSLWLGMSWTVGGIGSVSICVRIEKKAV